jgi:hypothetical protein
MWATSIIAIGGALAVVWGVTRPIIKRTRGLLESLSRFVRDWEGEEEAPGRAAVPGVMERLNRIDGELKHNGGSSMKDSLKRLEQNSKRIEQKINQIDARLEEGDLRMTELEKGTH